MNLHGKVMNLRPPRDPHGEPLGWPPAYLDGHKQARHDAAELANEADALIAELLAALQDVLPFIDDACDVHSLFSDSAASAVCRATVFNARAAIARATNSQEEA